MLRFIVKVQTRTHPGQEELVGHITIDAEVPELEATLNKGGLDEDRYCVYSLVGVDVRPPAVVP